MSQGPLIGGPSRFTFIIRSNKDFVSYEIPIRSQQLTPPRKLKDENKRPHSFPFHVSREFFKVSPLIHCRNE